MLRQARIDAPAQCTKSSSEGSIFIILWTSPIFSHFGIAQEVLNHRASVLTDAFKKYPNRFKYKIPVPAELPKAVWINPPSTEYCAL
jgi:hypothetical protein